MRRFFALLCGRGMTLAVTVEPFHMPLEITLGDSGETVIVSDTVIKHFTTHQQHRRSQAEAGGQLFGTISEKIITIDEATGPRRSDRRTRYSYIPDRKVEQREINDRFLRGVHFLGDWHTHPELKPHPSETDLRNMRECVRKSRRSLAAFLLIIVGTDQLPAGLHASLHNGLDALTLVVTEQTQLLATRPPDKDIL